MGLKSLFTRARDGYVYRQAMGAPLPSFTDSAPVRYRILFKGRVQKVGFRYETELLAQRLELTGWCINLPDGDVLAELQGCPQRIHFYVDFMKSLKRIRVDSADITPLPLDPAEIEFDKSKK